MADLSVLQKPFDIIRQREGAGGQSFAYVPGWDVLERIIEATQGEYDWEIRDLRLVEGITKTNKKTGEVTTIPSVWMVHGRLTIPGLGSKDGVGTVVAENEDSPKGAETDALKRAASKFGVALDLYQAEERARAAVAEKKRGGGTRPASNGAAPPAHINDTGAQCPKCNAPAGMKHVKPCI